MRRKGSGNRCVRITPLWLHILRKIELGAYKFETRRARMTCRRKEVRK